MSKPKFIESGWDSYRQIVVPADASEAQVRDTRRAFFGGAAILFQTIMLAMGPGTEESEADLRFMESIQAEVDEFGLEIDLELLPVKGHG